MSTGSTVPTGDWPQPALEWTYTTNPAPYQIGFDPASGPSWTDQRIYHFDPLPLTREELAARAMQGLLSKYGTSGGLQMTAADACAAADALLAELAKPKN